MQTHLPTTVEMIGRLVEAPSVSSVDPALDMGNRAVAEMLADWAEGLGFRIEWLPIPDQPDKVNLIATLGEGPGGLPATPIPSPTTPTAGRQTRS